VVKRIAFTLPLFAAAGAMGIVGVTILLAAQQALETACMVMSRD
jgi:hypothetical protein